MAVIPKTFIALENNPEVFAHLVQQLGVSRELGFYDIYSLDEPELLEFLPRPVFALLLIVPANVYSKARDKENESMPEYTGSGDDEPVVWFKQTIGNACGLIGLLHAVSNGGAKRYIHPDSDLGKLLKEAIPLNVDARANLLYHSHALESAHHSAALKGDTAAPPPVEGDKFHYICFVKGDDGHLWELNGGMKGPIDRGSLDADEDALSEKALELGVRTFMGKKGQDAETDLGFSIVALAPNLH